MRTCKNCGQELQNPKWNQLYCNIECQKKDYDKRDQLKKKQNGCVVCGFWRFTESHHIIKQIDFGANNENNLIKLCPNHHKMADSERYGSYFLKLLKKKTGKTGERLKEEEIKRIENYIFKKLKGTSYEHNKNRNSWDFHYELQQLINQGKLYKIAADSTWN